MSREFNNIEFKNPGKAVCNICKFEFELNLENHYIVRTNGKEGALSRLATTDEGNIYDAFDCPRCGCQKIVQHRLRAYGIYAFENGEAEDENSEDSSEEYTS